MSVRTLISQDDGPAHEIATDQALARVADARWVWVDVFVEEGDEPVETVVASLGLDRLALRDAMEDADAAKVDDFGDHLLVVLHGIAAEATRRIGTYELDCFLTERVLVTVHRDHSRSVDNLHDALLRSAPLGAGGPDALLARLADVVTRRVLALVEGLEDELDVLVERALSADSRVVADVTAFRTDLRVIRRIARPQRDVFDRLRQSTSPMLSDIGRRRFADVFDLTQRLTHALEAARGGLGEALDAYSGAEAKRATEVTRVLTIYAAVMLPLSLVAGFFGMNFVNLPWGERSWGWILVLAIMAAIALVSLGLFVISEWIRPLSAKRAGSALGRGLLEASKAPAELVGALYEVTTTPLRHFPGIGIGSRSQPNESNDNDEAH